MEDLDPDLFSEGDLPRKHPQGKHPRKNKLSPEERKKRRVESAKRWQAKNAARGLTKKGRLRVYPRDGLSERVRYSRLAKAVSQEEYDQIKAENRVLTRSHVSPISDAEAHEKMALNSLVKQEGGYLLRQGFMNCGEGGWMKKREH